MTVAPHAGIVDFGTFTSPTSSVDGIQGEVPQPLAGQQNYVLTANGWVALSSLGTLVFQGTWDASTNTPTLVSSVGVQGYYYVVSVAGNTDLNGITTWTEGDWAIFSGSVWQKIEGGSTVNITGGTINGTTIGATTPSSIVGTTITGQTGRLNGTGTNLLLRSQEFNDGLSWGLTTVTVTANSIAAPDGTTTADTLTGGVGTVLKRIFQSITITAGTYTFSVHAKAGTHNFIQFFYGGTGTDFADFNVSTGTAGTVQGTSSITSAGNGWYRCTHTFTANAQTLVAISLIDSNTASRAATTSATGDVYLWGAQLELGSTANTYIPTTSAAVYGTPTLSFSGVSTLGLESNGALFLQPAGTGAIQAQATTSTTAGGNVRGANAVDWQTLRNNASEVASGSYSIVGGGQRNTASGAYSQSLGGFSNASSGFESVLVGGQGNAASGQICFIGGGTSNTASGYGSTVVGGTSNTGAGVYSFIGAGQLNSGTSGSIVTTQSATMNATTAVTLSGSNASIKVGQYISGTSIGTDTYVAAISGTSLTLSKNASGSSTSTLSFFTPHGVVVGGGNNQATGSYSFIGGGGDAGTAAQRNTASGDWSVVVGGRNNVASGLASFVGGGGTTGDNNANGNQATGLGTMILGGVGNRATSQGASVSGGFSNQANADFTSIIAGYVQTARSIQGNVVIGTNLAGVFSFASGASQTCILHLGAQTTDATATALRSNGNAAGTTNQVILPNNSAYYFKGSVIANVTGGGDTSSWEFRGAIKRGANAASTVLVGTPKIDNIGYDAGASFWTFALTADTTNGGLRVTVTGQAATTIRWVAKIETTEVTF